MIYYQQENIKYVEFSIFIHFMITNYSEADKFKFVIDNQGL